MGINLDSQQNDGPKLDTVMPNIRRFVLDHNIPWPNLVNGTGAHDYAKAYGVSEIPANILIGRTGDVVHLDLGAKNLDSVVSQQCATVRSGLRTRRGRRSPPRLRRRD